VIVSPVIVELVSVFPIPSAIWTDGIQGPSTPPAPFHAHISEGIRFAPVDRAAHLPPEPACQTVLTTYAKRMCLLLL